MYNSSKTLLENHILSENELHKGQNNTGMDSKDRCKITWKTKLYHEGHKSSRDIERIYGCPMVINNFMASKYDGEEFFLLRQIIIKSNALKFKLAKFSMNIKI